MKRGGYLNRYTPLPVRRELVRQTELRRVAPMPAPRATQRPPQASRGAFPPDVRVLLRDRFGGLCVCCGEPLGLDWEAQHRRARGSGGSRDPLTGTAPNGLAMKRAHHAWVEANPEAASVMGYRVHQGTDPATVPVLLWDGSRVLLTDDGGYCAAEEAA